MTIRDSDWAVASSRRLLARLEAVEAGAESGRAHTEVILSHDCHEQRRAGYTTLIEGVDALGRHRLSNFSLRFTFVLQESSVKGVALPRNHL